MDEWAIITPTYRNDLERVQLLCESIGRCVKTPARHYLVVDDRDLEMFKPLAGERTVVLSKERVVDMWCRRIPFLRRGWWATSALIPVRGWILQQIAKLSATAYADSSRFLFLDSDAFFVRPTDLNELLQGSLCPLFRVEGTIGGTESWHAAATGLLGLQQPLAADRNYVGNPIVWKREVLESLHQRIASTTGRPWAHAVSRCLKFSEYTLYGRYVENVLGMEAAGHYANSVRHTWECWSPLASAGSEFSSLDHFFELAPPGVMLMMISAKAGIAPTAYAKKARELWHAEAAPHGASQPG